MPFVVACPTCRHPLTVLESQAGSVVACPTCHQPLAVPAFAVVAGDTNGGVPFDAMNPPQQESPKYVRPNGRRPGRNGSPLAAGCVGAFVLVCASVAGGWFMSGRSNTTQDAKHAVPLVKPAANPIHNTPPKSPPAPAAPKPGPVTKPTGVPSPKSPPTPKQEEDNAARLRRIDEEVMDAFRRGDRYAISKLFDAVKPYTARDAAECTPDEAIALAVILTRIVSLAGKQLPKDVSLAYTTTIGELCTRGGIRADDRLAWFDRILKETVAAYGKK